jgi:dihydropteroate synthase
MGVLNVTPDSFSDGGELFRGGALSLEALCHRAEAMIGAGAAVLDVGGESTRPGAAGVSEQEELDRVLPAIEALRRRFDVVLSLDTSSPAVMREGAALGAGLINDVRALGRPGAIDAAVATGLPVCLMHMQGQPTNMQARPSYDDVVATVSQFLIERRDACVAAGISRENLLFDPGFGFGKSAAHNYVLLHRLAEIVAIGQPVLAGLSRKSMIAAVIDRPADARLSASLALAVLAANAGARLIRVHDVAETADALAMVAAMENFE